MKVIEIKTSPDGSGRMFIHDRDTKCIGVVDFYKLDWAPIPTSRAARQPRPPDQRQVTLPEAPQDDEFSAARFTPAPGYEDKPLAGA